MIFNHNFVVDLKLQRITNDDGKRVYVTPNGPYESVTSYISRCFAKPELDAWKKRVGDKKAETVRNAAAVRGTALHTATEAYLLNKPVDLSNSPNTKSLFHKVKPILDRLNNHRLMEKALYSDELQLAGSPDYIGDFDNQLAVADFKTNSYAQKTLLDIIPYFLQTAAYAVMFNERYGLMPQRSIIVITSPNAPQGILWDRPMYECISMLQRFRADPAAFCAAIPSKKK